MHRFCFCQQQILQAKPSRTPRRYSCLAREHQLKLNAQRPVTDNIRLDCIVIDMTAHIDWLFADAENLAYASADRNRPSLIRICFPVRGYEWHGCQVPAVRQVVVDYRLSREEIHILASANVPDIAE